MLPVAESARKCEYENFSELGRNANSMYPVSFGAAKQIAF